jgi:beta-glucosidase
MQHGGPTFCKQGAAADPYLESEAHDRKTIDLPPTQHALAKAVLAVGKPTVLVLMNAGMVAIDAEAAFDGQLAIVEAFYPGPYGGRALADSLYGKQNRWGRLP